jgi:hypothetical protein
MLALLAAEGTQQVEKLPIPPIAVALLAIALFGFLLLLTFAFRSVWHRH